MCLYSSLPHQHVEDKRLSFFLFLTSSGRSNGTRFYLQYLLSLLLLLLSTAQPFSFSLPMQCNTNEMNAVTVRNSVLTALFFSFFPFNKHSSYNCRRSAFSSSSWLITESSACCLQWAEVFVSWREKKSIQGIVATAIKNKNKRDDNNSTAGHH